MNGHWLNSCTEAQPYQPGSPLPIRNSEVKQVRAGVVLRWGTTREGPVLRFLWFSFDFLRTRPSWFCTGPACTFFHKNKRALGKKGRTGEAESRKRDYRSETTIMQLVNHIRT